MPARLDHPATSHDFHDPHLEDPGRLDHLGEWALLAIVAAGDAFAFYGVLALVMADSPGWVVAGLVLSLTSAAVLTTHLAGQLARRRKAGTASLGRGVGLAMIALWFALGVATLTVRIVESHAGQPATGLGGGSAFDAALTTQSGGPGTDAMAVVLFAVYLVGGVVAYALGYLLHNPLRRRLVRALARRRRAERQLRAAELRTAALLHGRPAGLLRRGRPGVLAQEPVPAAPTNETLQAQIQAQIRAVDAQADQLRSHARLRVEAGIWRRQAGVLQRGSEARADEDRRAREQHAADVVAAENRERRAAEEQQRRLTAAMESLSAAQTELRDSGHALDTARRELAESAAQAEAHATRAELLDDRYDFAHEALAAQADQLREHARHRLSRTLGNPASTSGVFHRPATLVPARRTA